MNQFWFIREGSVNKQILPHTETYIPLEVGTQKSLCLTEKIALYNIHRPKTCFHGECKSKNVQIPEDKTTNRNKRNNQSEYRKMKFIELGFAHIKDLQWEGAPGAVVKRTKFLKEQKAKGHMINTSLFNEVLKRLEDELVELSGTDAPADLLKAIQ